MTFNPAPQQAASDAKRKIWSKPRIKQIALSEAAQVSPTPFDS
jgi:hypothetical protein